MRAAIYGRDSTRRQAQTQTIDQQIDRLGSYGEAGGEALPEESVFRDDGYSGATLKRPGLDRLRDWVATAAFDRVVLTDPDRLGRSYVQQILSIEELQRHGCRIELLDRPMPRDPHDQLVLQIRGAVAEYERTLIVERTRRGRQRRFRAGEMLPWTPPPYGYPMAADRPRDPSGVTLDPAEAAVVAEMFALYAEGRRTLHGLVDHPHARDVRSPSGQPAWTGASARGVLRNPTYTGRVYAGRTRDHEAEIRRAATRPIGRPHGTARPVPGGEWIEVGAVPAVVTRELFDLVQAKLAANRSFAARNNTAGEYLLRALVSCGRCGLACPACRPHRTTATTRAPARPDRPGTGPGHLPVPVRPVRGARRPGAAGPVRAAAGPGGGRGGVPAGGGWGLAPAGVPGPTGPAASGAGYGGRPAGAADRGVPRERHPAAGVPPPAGRAGGARRRPWPSRSRGWPGRPSDSTGRPAWPPLWGRPASEYRRGCGPPRSSGSVSWSSCW